MRILLVLSIIFLILSMLMLYYSSIDSAIIFGLLFIGCLLGRYAKTFKRRKKLKKAVPLIKKKYARRYSLVFRWGQSFSKMAGMRHLFDMEKKAVVAKAPYTGKIKDENHFVIQSATATLVLIMVAAGVGAAASVMLATPLPMLLAPLPLLIPLVAPLSLDMEKNNRAQMVGSEMLAFLTYCTIVHSVDKTMFWTFSSVLNSVLLAQIKNDARIVLRFAKTIGEEEGTAILHMAKLHPNRKFREFLEKYVAFMSASPVSMERHVENAREVAMKDTVKTIKNYTNSTSMVFFMGTMSVSIIPIMITIMSFIPNASIDTGSLISIVFILPLIFVIMPFLMSPGSIFLRSDPKFFIFSPLFGLAAGVLAWMLPDLLGFGEMPLIAIAAFVCATAGSNWLKWKKYNDREAKADNDLPDMLDYVAEQKKGMSNTIEIFRQYAMLKTTPKVIASLLRGVISDISLYTTYEAFYTRRKFPSRTLRFTFFMLFSIYEHGGGTYKTMIEMAHSMRKIVRIKSEFQDSSLMSAMIMVASPAVFAFSVMMISFMSFGGPEANSSSIPVNHNLTLLQGIDTKAITDSLKPMVLMLGVTGGLGVSKIVTYSFKNTKYLFMSSAVSIICLGIWDTLFAFMQSFSFI